MKFTPFNFSSSQFKPWGSYSIDKSAFSFPQKSKTNLFPNFIVKSSPIKIPRLRIQLFSDFSLAGTISKLNHQFTFDDLLKKKFCGLSSKIISLLDSVSINIKRKSEDAILKLIQRIDSRNNKSTNHIVIELMQKYGTLTKLSDDEMSELLIALNKKDNTKLLGLLFGFLSFIGMVLGFVMPKNREDLMMKITA